MRFILSILLLILYNFGLSQTSGAIFYSPTAPGATAVLDPNSDVYVSGNGGFTASVTSGSADESSESEIQYSPLYSMETEPTGDLQTGAACGVSEIIDNPGSTGKAGYFYYHDPDGIIDNGDEHLLFRMRIANVGSGAYGYSVLLDTDAKIGAADPNIVSGNPGFEIEILYGSGNGGKVAVYLVDGESAPNQFTTLASYPNNSASRYQKSYISNTNCPGATDPIFIDFYIDYATIMPYISGPIRIAFATSSSASSALGGSASDIGGVDDLNIANDDSGFVSVIESFPNSDFSFSSGTILGENDLLLSVNCLEESLSQNRIMTEWDSAAGTGYYELQKSTDGINWKGIYNVTLNESVNAGHFSFIDQTSKTESMPYYRLRKQNQNGNTIYSSVYSALCMNDVSRMQIYPNPVNSLLSIYTDPEVKWEQHANIYDNFGRFVKTVEISPGETVIVDISELENGNYCLILTDPSGGKNREMFVKN